MTAAWRVPEAAPGLPRLFLGDRGFLQRYGSPLGGDEIARRMSLAARSGAGVAASDAATVEAACRTRDRFGSAILLHTQDLLRLGGPRDPRRCAATLRAYTVGRVPPGALQGDRLVGGVFEAVRDVPPYTPEEVAAAVPDEVALAFAVGLVERAQPAVVTFGGDWLDLCLAANLWSPIEVVAEALGAAAGPRALLLVFSYMGAIFFPEATGAPRRSHGWAMPVNLLGDGMMPDRGGLVAWAAGAGGLRLAVHALALGRIPVAPALDYVWNHLGVPLVVVGASTAAHIATLNAAAQRVLGRPVGEEEEA